MQMKIMNNRFAFVKKAHVGFHCKRLFVEKLSVFLAIVFLNIVAVMAQIRLDQDGRSKDDFPANIREALVKRQIEEAKKDFSEMLKRGEEAERLGRELFESYEQNKRITAEDEKKLERLEKLIKKICDDLGGDVNNDEEEQTKFSGLNELFEALKNSTEELASTLRKISRFTVSVGAIETSNSILKTIKFIKTQFARVR
ncbi:MAG: hypothetical protein KatS3mg006_0839 [Pyrinomonadaceae bacterium]|nr:MAG: hypothetical protein KatS3mg006_0839 [Pyrinomonadaceae bacterium]